MAAKPDLYKNDKLHGINERCIHDLFRSERWTNLSSSSTHCNTISSLFSLHLKVCGPTQWRFNFNQRWGIDNRLTIERFPNAYAVTQPGKKPLQDLTYQYPYGRMQMHWLIKPRIAWGRIIALPRILVLILRSHVNHWLRTAPCMMIISWVRNLTVPSFRMKEPYNHIIHLCVRL